MERTNNYYLQIGEKKVPVTEAVYRDYMRPVWREQKHLERQKRCRAEHGSRCTNDCSKCPHDRTGTPVSLDALAEKGYEAPAYASDPADAVQRRLLYDALYAAIGQLEPRDRKIVTMLHIEDMTERQVAAEVGLTQRGVCHVRHKAYAQLQVLLKDWH